MTRLQQPPPQQQQEPYQQAKDRMHSILSNRQLKKTRVDRLLDQMSDAELAGQMAQIDLGLLLQDVYDDDTGTVVIQKQLNQTAVDYYLGTRAIGSVLNTVLDFYWNASQFRQASIVMQETAARFSRPPVIWGLDSVHGANYLHGAVLSPQPVNLAATFNTTTAYQAGWLASRDTRAAGISWLFSPLLGLALEPAWSRVYETFGEDPVLVGEMAASMIQGIQKVDDDASNQIPSRAAACAKHFVGYSLPRHGHDRAPSWIPTRHLYQYFVPPWKRAVKAGVMTVMESYTETDGVPNVVNTATTQRLLRQELQFAGVLVTDYEEMQNAAGWHHVAFDNIEAVQMSLQQSSIDMSMIPWNVDNFFAAVQQGLAQGVVTRERLLTSARRVLELKQELHMFDETWTMENANLELVGTDREQVLHMVHQSMVLTENRENTLPLQNGGNNKKKMNVLVTGPTADSLSYQSGGWTWQWQGAPDNRDDENGHSSWFTYGQTVRGAAEAESDWSVVYRCGTGILGDECVDEDDDEGLLDQLEDLVGLSDSANSIKRAASAASTVDVVILCVGEEAYTEKPGDLDSAELPAGQVELVKAIRENNASAKIVLVYFGGRPRLLAEMVPDADAVLVAFLPGPDAGPALLDLITGRVSPSGRLPLTYPSRSDGAGTPYFHALSDQCTAGDGGPLPHRQYVPCVVQWPFGHGLSYTTFDYSDFSATGGIDSVLEVSVTVKNTGDVEASEAVLFFTFDKARSTTPEVKLLRAFDKVFLAPGEETTVTKVVPLDDLRFIGPDDDHHYILDTSIRRWVGVGHTTDCRDENIASPDNPNYAFCRLLERTNTKSFPTPVCEAACRAWTDSGCDAASTRQCLSTCGSAHEAWDWNYVNCIESVAFDLGGATDQCWKLTSHCRDVFAADASHGPIVMDQSKNAIALFVGLFTAALIMYMMRGGSIRVWEASSSDAAQSVEFSRVHDEDDDDSVDFS